MNLIFYNDIFDITKIQLNRVNIIMGGMSSGKTRLLNYFYEGFSGKLMENFNVDGSEIKKNSYYILYISEEKMYDVEFKLGSKSILKSKLELATDMLEIGVKNKFYNNINDYIRILNQTFLEELDIEGVNFKLDVDKLISKMNQFIDFDYLSKKIDIMSQSEQIESIIKIYLSNLKQINNNCILLIDNIDMYFDKYTLVKYIELFIKISKEYDIIFICSIKNPLEIHINSKLQLIYLKNNKLLNEIDISSYLIEFLNLSNEEELYTLYSEEEIENYKKNIIDKNIELIHKYIILNKSDFIFSKEEEKLIKHIDKTFT